MAVQVRHIDADKFSDCVASGRVLVDFWATWCGPCRMQGKILDELAASLEEGSASILKIDIDGNPDLAAEYGVTTIPTLMVFVDGEVTKEFVGVQQAETLKNALFA